MKNIFNILILLISFLSSQCQPKGGGNNDPAKQSQTESSQQVTSTSQLTPEQNTQRNELAAFARDEQKANAAAEKRGLALEKKLKKSLA